MEQPKLRPFRPILRNEIPIYHGTPCENITIFQINKDSRKRTDFGLGIYFTTKLEQALEWSIRGTATKGFVYETYIDYRWIASGEVRIKEFLEYDEDFIRTYAQCRTVGIDPSIIKGKDIIYGWMLDSQGKDILEDCDKFNAGEISMQELRSKLPVFNDKDQLCLKTSNILDRLSITHKYATKLIPGKVRKEGNIKYKKIY